MKNFFEMTVLALLKYFLVLEVMQGEEGTFIFQKKYAEDVLKRFNVMNYEATTTPMNIKENLQREDGTEKANSILFRNLVGCLNYLMHIRPNITFFIDVVSRFCKVP